MPQLTEQDRTELIRLLQAAKRYRRTGGESFSLVVRRVWRLEKSTDWSMPGR
jgi:hypothetical protein